MATTTRARRPADPPASTPGAPLLVALQRNRRWIAGGVAALAVALLGWILWPTGSAPESPRAREYLEFTACLLTGERGVTETSVAPVWAGMRDASLATRAKVQYLAITGPQTVDNGVTFLNSLAQAGCAVVLAAGELAVATVDQGAAQFPATRFHPVGGGTPTDNVRPLPATTPEQTTTAVSTTIRDAVAAAP